MINFSIYTYGKNHPPSPFALSVGVERGALLNNITCKEKPLREVMFQKISVIARSYAVALAKANDAAIHAFRFSEHFILLGIQNTWIAAPRRRFAMAWARNDRSYFHMPGLELASIIMLLFNKPTRGEVDAKRRVRGQYIPLFDSN